MRVMRSDLHPGDGLRPCGLRHRSSSSYNGPEVTQVQVHKADRKMYLLHNDEVLKAYDIELGFHPVGHKQFEGDGKTPEGSYYISHKNPESTITCRLAFPIRTRPTSPLPRRRANRPAATSSSTAAPNNRGRPSATGPRAASP